MTRNRPIRTFAALLAPVLLLQACDALTQPYPDRAMYAIIVDLPEQQDQTAGRGILKITRVRVTAPFDDRTFFYKVAENEFKADYYNSFAASPDRIFTSQLEAYLLGHGGFDRILPPFSGADADLRLEGNITALYADFSEGPVPDVVIEGRFFLVDLDLEKDTVFGDRSYQQRVRAASAEPQAIAEAWSEALTAMYAQMATELLEEVKPADDTEATDAG